MHIKFWSENLNERDHAEHLRVDGRIMLKWILKKNRMGKCGLDASGSG
jgi:hypothetical protein